MRKGNQKKIVRTEMDPHGIIIFRLMQGQKRMRTMHTFGYGTCHKLWYRLEGVDTKQMSITSASASVKEEIAKWATE